MACGGSSFPVAIGIGYNETKELGTLNIADDMRVQWCAGCDLTQYDRDAGEMWLGKQREPADPGKLHSSDADLRVSDCRHMTYVAIEKCPHPRESQGPYVDYSASQHYEGFSCRYCRSSDVVKFSNHEFDPNTHKCACGHEEYPVAFYGDASVDPDLGGNPLYHEYRPGGAPVTQAPDIGSSRSDGATFAGWYEKKADGALEDNAFDLSMPVHHALRLYAKWTPPASDPSAPKTFTVRFFDENGGLIQSNKVEQGGTASAPTVPTRAGYGFDGWYSKTPEGAYRDKPFVMEAPIGSNVDLYQKWTTDETTYQITFHPLNGAGDVMQTVGKNRLATPPVNPSNGDLRFTGWYKRDGDVYHSKPFAFSTPSLRTSTCTPTGTSRRA